MSGAIYPALEVIEEFDSTKWNPLHCNVCNEQYKEPCILQCYHSFCTQCIQGRVEEGKVVCPLCGRITLIKEGNTVPPPDPILKFLVESSTGETVTCANCDQTNLEMFHCKTCNQPLCVTCREDTHRAKMFSKHDVVLHTKHTRDIQKDCKIHGEPFILFSTEKKVMLCINCFRDMKVESRSHCVDLETAYKQGCQKIDDTMQSIRDLQSSVRDGILLLRALLEEIQINADNEKQDINDLYNTMQEKIIETKEALLQEIDKQFVEKEELFKNQLVSLRTFLPTLHVHLVTCAAFCGSTSKYEFLDFTYEMMRRLTAIIQVPQPLHPSQTSEILTDYKTKLARCLEPLLFPHRNGITVPVSIATNVSTGSRSPDKLETGKNVSEESPDEERINKTRRIQNKKKLKLKLMENKGFFADHCKEFDESHMGLMGSVDSLKQAVQELQRDITLRRSLTKDLTINDLKTKISQTEELLDVHFSTIEEKQPGLEQHWEESLEMIAAEQEVYQAQLQDIGRLKNEVCSVKTILQKLMSFMSSIANVTQRLAPKLGKATSAAENDSQHNALFRQISEMQPDSQQRVDAIRNAEEERDIKTANRVNPLDEELIKTKGLLRAPSARKDPTKRLSTEIKESGSEDAKKISATSKDQETDKTDLENDKDELKCSTDSIKSTGENLQNGPVSPCSDHSGNASTENDTLVHGDTLNSDISIVNSPEDQENDDIMTGDVTGSMPDITVLVARADKVSESSSTGEDTEGNTSSIAVVTPESDSELDISVSIESLQSEESENVRPGHVKDLIAKVDNISNLNTGDKSPGARSPTMSLSDKLCISMEDLHIGVNGRPVTPDSVSPVSLEANGVDNDRMNQFVSLDSNGKAYKVKSGDENDVSENGVEISEASGDGDEVYVAKSLPELAQVFEPGELKQKKRKAKNGKGKQNEDKN
ncbi:RING finger protein 207-like [Ruditapes philippinarum]|uniref:RING finger protein 207-like n=1 Tax=Ruditapes philippinarum TaxID=129788 RepID=UPI00295BA601|nr:RING finger protein 207-like [Ruditapes philippinarum]